ncbi:MAG: MarR family transcriptional regulator [Thermodesulfovibrionia bacterium]|nr:MarR family transcriptional regulator [Thermodesulfovibrionia bacterium]
MERKKSTKEITDLFIRMVNKYNALEKVPVKFKKDHNLYHSERHMIDSIGENPEMNMKEFAESLGVTKGAVSQVVSKLEKKGIVKRNKKSGNEKEVILNLTREGSELYKMRKKVNEESLLPLYNKLKRHSNEEVDFLINMFKWFNGFLDLSKKRMEEHHK